KRQPPHAEFAFYGVGKLGNASVGHRFEMADLGRLLGQRLVHCGHAEWMSTPALALRIVEDSAYALANAARGFRLGQPNLGQGITDVAAFDLIDRQVAKMREGVAF